jgi:uncharacterized protein YuzE
MAPISNREIDQERTDALRRLLEANSDLEQRIRTSEISAVFDLEDDLLAITFDKPQEALTLDVDGCLFFRVDPDTYKIVGIEVWHAFERLSERGPVSRIAMRVLAAAGSRVSVVRPASTGTTNLVEDVRKLVSA